MATTNATPAATPAVPTKRLAAARTAWANHGRRWLLQALALAMIWGITWFIWGSLNAWGRYQAKHELEAVLQTVEPMVSTWLNEPLTAPRQVAADPTLIDALQTPLGLASPAAERALALQAERLRDPDMILFDVVTGRTLTVLGSTPPTAEVLRRLSALPPTAAKLVASGTRTGIFYWAWRVPLPEPAQVYVVRALSVRQLAGLWRQAPVPENMVLSLALPHAEGASFWRQSEPLRLSLVETLPQIHRAKPSAIYPAVTLATSFQKPLPPVALLPKVLVVMWAVAASLAVLWSYTAPVRAAVWGVLGPRLGPLLQRLQTFWQKLGGWTGLRGLWRMLLGRLVGLLSRRKAPQGDDETWDNKRGEAAQEADLVEGPGLYSPADFGQAAPAKPLLKPRLKPLTPKETSATTAVNSEVEPSPDILRDRIQRCIRQGLVELLYQPMYRNADNAVEGNEVLARLNDVSGVIAPGQFLPVLTTLGQVSALDSLVFDKVIEQHFAAGRSPPVMLSLNISGTSLEDLGYLRDVAKRGPSVLKHLMFEVRSNEVVRDPNALQLLKALQRQGARVAVDYFGGGSAMVEASKALGIDYIKLDMMRFTSSSTLKKEFNEVCSLAETLKLSVVVEKIESKDTETMARQAGATLLQGYGMGKPAANLVTLPINAKL